MTKAKTMWQSFTQRLTVRISKPTVALTLCALTLALLAQPVWRALAAAGDLDTSFSGDGVVVLNTMTGYDPRIAVQHDGKVLVLESVMATHGIFELVRLKLNGEYDETFSGDGIINPDLGLGDNKAADLAIQFNGKIVVAANKDSQFFLFRYLPNGNLDTSFSGDGIQIGANNTEAQSVAIQSDNKVLVAGKSSSRPFMARFNSNGSLDTSFGFSGYLVVTDALGASGFHKIAVQSDGKILAASADGMRRYLASGQLDTTFGSIGIVQANIVDFELLSSGKMVVLVNDVTIRRWLSTGLVDSTFTETTLSCANCISFSSLAVQENGKLLAASKGNIASTVSNLVRLNSNGGLDASFGSGGYLQSVARQLPDVKLMADQRIVVTGFTTAPGYSNQTSLARYLNDNTGTQITDVSVGTITVSPAAVNPGDTVVYTIPVKNNSGVKATHVTLSANVPVGTTFQGVSVASGWAALQQPSVGGMGTVSASAYELAPGATANVIVLVKVPPTTPHGKNISLSASVSNTTTEITNNNNGYKVFTVQ